MDETQIWALWATLMALLCVSAFFSGSETGMMSLNRYRLKHQRKKSSGARRAAKLLDAPDKLISLILVGNNAVNILAAIMANTLAVIYVGEAAGPWVATAVLTIMMLVFSEVTPKTIAAQNPEWVAFKASHILRPLSQILAPLVWMINKLTNSIIRLLGFDPDKGHDDALDTQELRTVVDASGHKISGDHQNMLKGLLDLETVTVEDIMIPRAEIEGINLDDPIEAIVEQLITSDFTRIPLYQGDINNWVGVFHVRKLNHLLRSESITHNALKRFAEEAYFIPESTSLANQLINFKESRSRFAAVVDEYGEVQGLVTLEDILEEIVGDFTDSGIAEQSEIEQTGERHYRIEGTASIRDINKATDWTLPTDGPKTLNGLALEHLESIPEGNVCFTLGGYRFTTLTIQGNMIEEFDAQALHRRSADE